MTVSRRALLGGMGHIATMGALASTLPRPALAAAPASGAAPAVTYCLSSLYQLADGATFNADLFRDEHLPLLRAAYGSSVERIELRVPTPMPEGSPPPKIIAATNIWFRDVNNFLKRNTSASREIAASLAEVTTAPLIGQVDQILKTLGEDRTVVPVDSLCVSNFFPAKEGSTFDLQYFAETFYPRLAEIYGTSIYRIELSAGAAGSAGGKATLQNSAHIYIRDVDAFIEAEKKAGELATEAQSHSNIALVRTLMRLHAAS